MKKLRYSDSQILAILNQAEAGTPVSAPVPRAWYEQRDIVQMAGQMRRYGYITDGTN